MSTEPDKEGYYGVLNIVLALGGFALILASPIAALLLGGYHVYHWLKYGDWPQISLAILFPEYRWEPQTAWVGLNDILAYFYSGSGSLFALLLVCIIASGVILRLSDHISAKLMRAQYVDKR